MRVRAALRLAAVSSLITGSFDTSASLTPRSPDPGAGEPPAGAGAGAVLLAAGALPADDAPCGALDEALGEAAQAPSHPKPHASAVTKTARAAVAIGEVLRIIVIPSGHEHAGGSNVTTPGGPSTLSAWTGVRWRE